MNRPETWSDVFRRYTRLGYDYAYAAHMADQWEKRNVNIKKGERNMDAVLDSHITEVEEEWGDTGIEVQSSRRSDNHGNTHERTDRPDKLVQPRHRV